jgi:hypothetical protein
MSDLFFNASGKTHTLRVLPVDEKPGDITVYEAMTDSEAYTYFEAPHDTELWALFELAISSYLEYRVDNKTVQTRWRDN